MSVPHTQRAWLFAKNGLPSANLRLEEIDVPTPKGGEILVQVKAAALNPVDIQVANATPEIQKYLPSPAASPQNPRHIGQDFSGVIVALGPGADASRFSVGQEVIGLLFDISGKKGTLSEYIVVDPQPEGAESVQGKHTVVRKPEAVDWVKGAGLPLVYSTVHTALVKYGGLAFPPSRGDATKEKSVLILGGSSGTGSMAVQMCSQMPDVRGRIVATCSGRNADFVSGIGASQIIDYTTQDQIREALNSPHAPFDVIFDCVGGTDWLPHLDRLLKRDEQGKVTGMYVTIVGDKTSHHDIGGAITNNWTPAQTTRENYACINLEASTKQFETIEEYLKGGGGVIVDEVFGFQDVKKAYERQESGRARGKVIVDFSK